MDVIKMREEDIPDLNIFMMCEKLNNNALSNIPKGYYIRNCRPDELEIWMNFPFDNEVDKIKYRDFMINYFNDVYKDKEDEFYNRCLFICDKNDKPISTCFIWKAYNKINAIHWLKTLKEYENNGFGRALLSYLMKSLKDEDYPIFLHTQPGSFRAIGLYSDFGFKIVTNKTIGIRNNDYEECLPILKRFMRKDVFDKLEFIEAPSYIDECAKSSKVDEF